MMTFYRHGPPPEDEDLLKCVKIESEHEAHAGKISLISRIGKSSVLVLL